MERVTRSGTERSAGETPQAVANNAMPSIETNKFLILFFYLLISDY